MPDDSRIDPAVAGQGGLDRVLTVPNAVTAIRLLCVPLFVWLLFGAGRQSAAAVLLAVLGATDWVDGFIARRFHQVSNVGKVLDPAADRILVATGVVAVIVHGAVPVWFGVATLAREVAVGGTVLLLATLGASRIDVLWVGKAGTFGLMFAYPAFLLGHGTAGWQDPVRTIAWVTGAIGLTLAWVAAFSYVGPARRALTAGRAGRAARAGHPGVPAVHGAGRAVSPGAGRAVSPGAGRAVSPGAGRAASRGADSADSADSAAGVGA